MVSEHRPRTQVVLEVVERRVGGGGAHGEKRRSGRSAGPAEPRGRCPHHFQRCAGSRATATYAYAIHTRIWKRKYHYSLDRTRLFCLQKKNVLVVTIGPVKGLYTRFMSNCVNQRTR